MGKKLLVFLMILSLLGSCVSALADEVEMEPREIWKNAEYVDGSFRNLEEPQVQEVAVMMEGALQTSHSTSFANASARRRLASVAGSVDSLRWLGMTTLAFRASPRP